MLNDDVRLALAALAVFQLAQLIVFDEGPLKVFGRLRAWGCSLPKDSLLRHILCGYDEKPSDGILFCPYCAGMWLSFALGAMTLFPTPHGDAFILVLGLAGAAVWLERMANHL